MKPFIIKILFVLLIAGNLLSGKVLAEKVKSNTVDIVVYGSTPGGIFAAIAAAREGANTLLIEPTSHMGGLVTGGLSFSDSNQMHRDTLMGLFHEFHSRIVADYKKRGKPAPYNPEIKNQARWTYEPHVAMRIYKQMLEESGVTVHLEKYLEDVAMQDGRITSIKTSGGTYSGKVFVDATYEGDLMAASGVEWTIGREGRKEFEESLAGKQYPKKELPINGFDDEGNLLPLLTGTDAGPLEDGDDNIMTYSFRLCLTNNPENRVPMPKPDNYDPTRFEIMRRTIKAGFANSIWFDPYPLPNRKFDGNNAISKLFSLGLIGGAKNWHSSDKEGRQRIWEDHKQYTLEFIHFLSTDPTVPKAMRARYAQWGLCKDEFLDTGHFSPALYVRESRRMKGMYTLSQKDIRRHPVKDDPIAISSFPIDSHDCQRIALPGGGVIHEGTIYPVKPTGHGRGYAYHVPYRSILPKPEQCKNLLVPVALSSTHVAISSLRIEAAWMVIGQGAGVAAAIAADQELDVQQVPYPKLRERLLAQKQVLDLTADKIQWRER